jgi:hypothetical protein
VRRSFSGARSAVLVQLNRLAPSLPPGLVSRRHKIL